MHKFMVKHSSSPHHICTTKCWQFAISKRTPAVKISAYVFIYINFIGWIQL